MPAPALWMGGRGWATRRRILENLSDRPPAQGRTAGEIAIMLSFRQPRIVLVRELSSALKTLERRGAIVGGGRGRSRRYLLLPGVEAPTDAFPSPRASKPPRRPTSPRRVAVRRRPTR